MLRERRRRHVVALNRRMVERGVAIRPGNQPRRREVGRLLHRRRHRRRVWRRVRALRRAGWPVDGIWKRTLYGLVGWFDDGVGVGVRLVSGLGWPTGSMKVVQVARWGGSRAVEGGRRRERGSWRRRVGRVVAVGRRREVVR